MSVNTHTKLNVAAMGEFYDFQRLTFAFQNINSNCLRVTTGPRATDEGFIDVFVDQGDGNGYVEVTRKD